MPDPSTGTEPIEAEPADIGKTDASAVSSSQEGGESSLLDSVAEALGDSKKEPPPSSDAGSVDPAAAPKEPSAEDPLGEITDQEIARYGPKTQRRIKQLLEARAESTAQVETLRPKAESFDKLDEYIRTNRLSNEDFAVLLEIGALVRNDPGAARDRLLFIAGELGKATGYELPPDLQERVKLGYLTEDDARALSQSRNKAAFLEQRAKEQEAESQAEQSRQRVNAHVQTCRNTANKWEAQRRSTDPDWKEKQGKIGQLIELEVYRNGYPKTQEEVVQMLDGFLTSVNEELSRYKPKLREVRPTMSSASSRASSAEPTTLMEAVEAALAQ